MPDDSSNRYTLSVGDDTNGDYPTRCSSCGRPVERFSLFPEDRCLDCHAAVTPMPTASDVVRLWGGTPTKEDL